MVAVGRELRYVILAIVYGMLLAYGSLSSMAQTRASGINATQEITHAGVHVSFSVEPLNGGTNSSAIHAEDDVLVWFKITDAATGAAVKGVYPEAWINSRPPPTVEGSVDVARQIQSYRSGGLFNRPDIDLNVYYVVTLNDDATVSVVDPLFGFGGTKLLAMVKLNARGEDWVLSADQSTLYVSMPETNQVAVIDTRGWQVKTNLPTQGHSGRLLLQPDEAFLWVTHENGTSVFKTSDLTQRAQFSTGYGPHEITVSEDNRRVYVADGEAGTITVIDVPTMSVTRQLPLGGRLAAMSYSKAARALYAINDGTGEITVIDGERSEIVRRLKSEAGANMIRFCPDSRFAIVLNPSNRSLSVMDAARNQFVQTGKFHPTPTAVDFSDSFAYLRSRESEIVQMLPLEDIGREGMPLSAADFPAGQSPPNKASKPALAPTLVTAPGESAVLVANAADEAVYYYKEGMAAPMGHFNNYDRQPRAVLAVDRTLRSIRNPGVYETVTRFPSPGRYLVFFYLNTPRFAHCFELSVAEGPNRQGIAAVELQMVNQTRLVSVGEPTKLQFQALDAETRQAKKGIKDFGVLVMTPPGLWHHWYQPEEVNEGVYQLDFVPPKPGVYQVFIQSASQNLGSSLPATTLRAVPAKSRASSVIPAKSSLAGAAPDNYRQ